MVMDNTAYAPQFVATEKLWQTADRERLVKDGDPEAAFLFCVPGQEVSPADVERYGIAKAKPEAKAVSTAPENKAVTKTATKDRPGK